MKVVIIIPTYNEKENIGRCLASLVEEFPQISHEMDVLVVDGHSPDGTANIVRNFSKEYPNVHLLLEEEKGGLGAAYVFGMKHAMSKMGAEVVVEMDADLQHNPADVKKFLAEIDAGADFVLGSRFVEGGSIPKHWAFKRKFLSVVGNIYGRLMMGTWQVSDITTGFRATRVKNFLEKIDLNNLLSRSYAYKLHLLYETLALGAKVKEVPIEFAEREKGYSKMDSEDFKESLRVVTLIRFKKSRRLIRFAVVGVIGFIVQTTVFELLLRSKLPYLGLAFNATALSAEAAVVSNFIWSNFWTFADRGLKLSQTPLKFVQFNLGSLGSIGAQWLTVRVGTHFFGSDFLAVHIFYMVGIGLGMISNYLVYSRIVWGENHDTAGN